MSTFRKVYLLQLKDSGLLVDYTDELKHLRESHVHSRPNILFILAKQRSPFYITLLSQVLKQQRVLEKVIK